MKNNLHLLLVMVAALALGIATSFAQPAPVVGDVGSVITGPWSDPNTWRGWDGSGWITVVGAPGSSSSVFVLTGTTVTYDHVLAEGNNCKKLIVQSGAVFKSDVTLPSVTYLRIRDTDIWVDGQLGNNSTDGLSLELRFIGTITMSGSGTVNVGQVRPYSANGAGSLVLVFARNANINFDDGSGNAAALYTSRGTQTDVTYTINSGVTVTLAANSNLQVASSSASNGAMNSTINVNGTLNMPSSSLILANALANTTAFNIGATGIVNVGKKLTPFITGGSLPTITVASGGALNILSGGTADFTNGSAAVTGAGTFALNSGATINVGAATGLNGASGPVQTTTKTFNTAANYNYVGTSAQVTGALLPATVNDLTINNSSGVLLSSNATVNGTLYLTAGVFNNSSATLVAPTIVTVSGSLSTPLPVELTSFTGSARGRTVELRWNTATETSNSGFEVEKNVSGTWSKVGFVNGAGTSAISHNYSFADVNSAAASYSYRLKQIDRDGKFTYSNAVEVTTTLSAEDFKLSQNFPNPFNPSTKFSFALKNAERTTVKVYNLVGQEVATLFNEVAQPGQVYSLTFDAKNLPSGMYFYTLHSQSRNEIKKMMLLK